MNEDKASLDTLTPMDTDPLLAPNLRLRNQQGEPISLMQSVSLWGADRHVARTQVSVFDVSTVFMPVNMNARADGIPINWETMIFGPEPFDAVTAGRYPSRAAAVRGHLQAVDTVVRWVWGNTPVARQHGMMRHLRSVRRSLLPLGQVHLPRNPKWGSTVLGVWTVNATLYTRNNE